MRIIILMSLVFHVALSSAQVNAKLKTKMDLQAKEVEAKMIGWRRDFHQYPELSNREKRTAAKVAEHLRSLGIEVQTDIAYTGVVGILKGAKPGPTARISRRFGPGPEMVKPGTSARSPVPAKPRVDTAPKRPEAGLASAS